MVSIYIRSVFVLLALPALLLAATLHAVACSSSPPTEPQATDRSLGSRWISVGISDLRARDYLCAQKDFFRAATFLRVKLGEPDYVMETRADLAFALSQEGVASSKLGQRKLAVADWLEAARLTSPPMFSESGAIRRANDLFARHQYHAAIKAYRDFIFFGNGDSRLSSGEWDNGAAAALRKGIDLALQGKYSLAVRTLRTSPPSQAASFLQGQTASIIGDYRTAYDAYVNELLAYLDLPAQPGAAIYGTVFDRPTWLRLVKLTNQ